MVPITRRTAGRTAVTLAIVLLCVGDASADAPVTDEPDIGLHIGAGGLVGVPFGTLRGTVGMTGGVGYEFAYRLPWVPILLGFNGEFWQYSTDAGAMNSAIAGHLLARFQRSGGTVRPYAEGLIGVDYIATFQRGVERPLVETRALGLGIGAGVTRTLSESNGLSLDVRARYRSASAATFISTDLRQVKARTRMLTVYIGFAVDL